MIRNILLLLFVGLPMVGFSYVKKFYYKRWNLCFSTFNNRLHANAATYDSLSNLYELPMDWGYMLSDFDQVLNQKRMEVQAGSDSTIRSWEYLLLHGWKYVRNRKVSGSAYWSRSDKERPHYSGHDLGEVYTCETYFCKTYIFQYAGRDYWFICRACRNEYPNCEAEFDQIARSVTFDCK